MWRKLATILGSVDGGVCWWEWCVYACVWARSLQSCPTLCSLMDCSPPGRLCMGFSKQECWSGFPCPPPGDLPDPGIKPVSLLSPELAGEFFTTSAAWEAGLKYIRSPSHICTACASAWEAAPRDLLGSIPALLQGSALISPFLSLLDHLVKTSILSPSSHLLSLLSFLFWPHHATFEISVP